MHLIQVSSPERGTRGWVKKNQDLANLQFWTGMSEGFSPPFDPLNTEYSRFIFEFISQDPIIFIYLCLVKFTTISITIYGNRHYYQPCKLPGRAKRSEWCTTIKKRTFQNQKIITIVLQLLILHKSNQTLLKLLSLYEGYCNIYSSHLKHPEIFERNFLFLLFYSQNKENIIYKITIVFGRKLSRSFRSLNFHGSCGNNVDTFENID